MYVKADFHEQQKWIRPAKKILTVSFSNHGSVFYVRVNSAWGSGQTEN
jgi:hypothetical protein